MNAIATMLARWLSRRRGYKTVRVVDQAPLFGGATVHVLDVDARRFVIATSPGAICLLAHFESAHPDIRLEGAREPRGEMSYCGCARARPDTSTQQGVSE